MTITLKKNLEKRNKITPDLNDSNEQAIPNDNETEMRLRNIRYFTNIILPENLTKNSWNIFKWNIIKQHFLKCLNLPDIIEKKDAGGKKWRK